MSGELIRFPWRNATVTSEVARSAGEAILSISHPDRTMRAGELHLEDPEQLLALCEILRRRHESGPADVRAEAAYFYSFLDRPRRPIGRFDEREYFLGEFALIAGTACRFLSLRDEARRWFDLSESNFVLAHNASAHIARIAFQRLTVRVEERQFEAVAELVPRWIECFLALGLPEEALKCRFLEAHALKETERLQEAKSAFRRIAEESLHLKNEHFAAIAAQNLFQIHVFLGENEEAVEQARLAAPVFRRLNSRVNSAKLQLGVGYLLRSEQRLKAAIDAFREAQLEFVELGMRADAAATHLVIADLLLDANQPAQAEWEIRSALPVIDELKLVPEGIAALSLLRDSIRRRQIDRQALRSLNGYFEELKS